MRPSTCSYRPSTKIPSEAKQVQSASENHMTHRRPAGLIKRAVSRDGRLMNSSPGVTFLRLIGAAKIPRACRKPSRYITYRARLMGLGDRIDVFFHAFSDAYSRLGD